MVNPGDGTPMTKKSDKKTSNKQKLPRVISDFGGRRKIFERRLRPTVDERKERRSGEDRRSGFDRRGTLSQSNETDDEKRSNPPKGASN